MGHGAEEPPNRSHEERVKHHMQLVYTRQLREKQIFMQELSQLRKKKEKALYKKLRDAVGPRWYQALSVPQRLALDQLSTSIYQDDLEGRPHRTASIMRTLGLYPRPTRKNLLECIYLSHHNPMEMLAQLYLATFNLSIEAKRESYCLNARLMLSAILYLGMNNLIKLLRETFQPDVVDEKKPSKPKPRPKSPVASPYLQEMVAVLWEKPARKRPTPPPLPNLDNLNDPYEEEPVVAKPPPPPPRPPPPKKRIPREVCDELAGIYPLERPRRPSELDVVKKSTKGGKSKGRQLKPAVSENKKVYGLGFNFRKKTTYRKKPVVPVTGMSNTRYTINGVFEINGKTTYILGNVCVLPAQGELIHGGYATVDNQFINIHCGYRGRPPPPKPDPCDCVKKYQETIFKYIKTTKCYCGHHYDFGNEGTFPPEELPFFLKPTRHSTMHFNYQTIFNLDNKELHVDKEFKKIWDTDSMLQVENAAMVVKNDKKKKKKERSSKTCLGPNPRPVDYLKCALRFMRRVNVAARLPDLHLVPELKEWMRRRIYGPLNPHTKADLLRQSTTYWAFFSTLALKGYGHVAVPTEEMYTGHTTWLEKQKLNDHFKQFTNKYRLAMYRSHAKVSNLFWRSMFQAEEPDKQFRQIFFSYLFSRIEDLQIIPYIAGEARERANIMRLGRYVCLPAGAEEIEGK